MQVRPGDVVELTYGAGKLLEVETVDTHRADRVVVFHGWMLDPRTGAEQHVDDAKWGFTTPLWWLDNLSDLIAYEPTPPTPPTAPTAGPGSAMRDAALAYAHAGVPVFPCYGVLRTVVDERPAIVCACGDLDCGSPGKHPITRHGVKDATSDPQRVAAWWKHDPGANIGIATGVAFDVLDLDGADGIEAMRAFAADHDLDLSRAPVVRTGSGGYHYLFAASGAGNRAGFLPHVDWRGIGGYVIAPPSQHVRGRRYAWADGRQWHPDEPLPQVPAPLLEEVRRRDEPTILVAGPRFTPAHTKTAYGRAALDGELAKVRSAPNGKRNHTLNAAGCKLFSLVAGGVLDEGDVREGLTSAAQQAGLQPKEIAATLKSAHAYGISRPRGIPERPFPMAIQPPSEPPGGELTISP